MILKKTALVSTLFVLAAADVHAHTERTRIELTDRVVEGLIDHPESEGPHPFLILAAGDESDIKNPLYAKIVAAAVADDFVTLRLDWSYKMKKGTASADLKREAEELGVVITQMVGSRMMKQFEIDTTKVALIAKGLGAKIAMIPESGGSGEKVKATLLLNPVCDSSAGSFATLYAPFLAQKKPRMIIASRSGGCALSQIHSAVKDFGDESTVFTLEGDPFFVSEKNHANAELALGAGIGWLRNLGWSSPKPTKKKPDAKKHIHEAQSVGTHP